MFQKIQIRKLITKFLFKFKYLLSRLAISPHLLLGCTTKLKKVEGEKSDFYADVIGSLTNQIALQRSMELFPGTWEHKGTGRQRGGEQRGHRLNIRATCGIQDLGKGYSKWNSFIP